MIKKYLDISTAHLSYETMQKLEKNKLGYPRYKYKFGFFMYISSKKELCSGIMTEAQYSRLPQDFLDILRYARKKKCTLICIDQDADVSKHLPVYDW